MSNTPTESVVILIVDPNSQSQATIRSSLAGSGHRLVDGRSVAEGLDLVDQHKPALVISELDLPDGSGFSLCRQIRLEQRTVQVMMVSRWAREADRILAFECGADDFLAKPFFERELASRTRALLRRRGDFDSFTPQPLESETATARPVVRIDARRRQLEISGKRVAFTPREFMLLCKLMEGRGRVMSRSDLVGESCDELPTPGIRSVDAHIKSIRQKLGPMGQAIETVRGAGYRYTGSDAGIDRID